MGHVPDARPAADAVERLADELSATLRADDPPDPATAHDWSRLHAQVLAADATLRWSRDAALLIAHHAGASWAQLAADSGTPDSTLDQRARAWARRETP